MAIKHGLEGFETLYGCNYDGTATIMWDAQKARSGSGYLKCYQPTSSSSSFRFAITFPDPTPGSSSVSLKCVARFFIRIIQHVSQRVELFSANHSPGVCTGVALETDGTLTPFCSTFGVPNLGTPTSMAIEAVTGNDFDKWYEVEVTLEVIPTTGAYTSTVALTNPAGTTVSSSKTRTGSTSATSLSNPSFFPTSNAIGVTASGEVDLDDVIYINASGSTDVALAVLPTEDRIAAIFATGPGTHQEWTGTWARAANAYGYTPQTATTSGLRTTFTHDTWAGTGLGITSIGAIMLGMWLRTTSSTASKFLYNGGLVDGKTSSSNATPTLGAFGVHYSELGNISEATFDAMEFGCQSNYNAATNSLYTIWAYILYSGNAQSTRLRSTGGGYQQKWVAWTGDGSADPRAFTGLGFAPHFAFLCPLQNASAVAFQFKNADMPGNISANADASMTASIVQSFDTDGFSVKAAANVSGQKWVALCIRDDGDATGGRVLLQGAMPRNGNIALSEIFAYDELISPDLIFIGRPSTGTSFLKTSTMNAADSFIAAGTSDGTVTAAAIVSFDANGFSLGTYASALSTTYLGLNFFGFRITDEIATGLAVGSIPPNDSNVQVTLAEGFDPFMVWAKGVGNGNAATKRLAVTEYSGVLDTHLGTATQTPVETNGIYELTAANRTFSIRGGTALGKHLDASPAVTAHWVAFALEAIVPAPPDPTEATFASGSITHPLTWMEFTDRDSNLEVFAEVDLNDKGTYYGGYKQPRVIKFQSIRRGLSDQQGQIEHLAFGAVMSDTDRYFRGLLGNITGRYITNRPLVQRMIDDEDRRLELVPRLAAVGYVSDYEPLPNFQFRMSGQDWLKKKYLRRRDSLQEWQKKVTLADFPNAVGSYETTPATEGGEGTSVKFDSVGKIVPIIYGRITDTNLTDTPGVDSGDGQFIPIYVGDYTILGDTWRGALVAAHHCAYIEEGYIDNDPVGIATNADWLTPRNAALWASAGFTTPWTTINGQDYCLIYVKGEAGDKFIGKVAPRDAMSTPFAINVWGRTDTGDDLGTLLTDGFDIYLDFLRNYVAPATPWTSGAPLTIPEFPTVAVGIVNEASFTTAQTEANARVAGGYVLDFAIQKPMSALDVLASFNKSLDCEGYFMRNGQYAISMEPVSLVSSAGKITDVLDIKAGTFKIVDEVQTSFFNVLPYQHTEDYCGRSVGTTWRSGLLEAVNSTSVANYDQERASGIFNFWMIRGRNRSSDSEYYDQGTLTVADVVARILKRYANIRRSVTLALPFTGLMYELGDIFPLTSVEGIGADGWINRTVRVLRHEVFPSEGKVLLDCYDLEVVLGDYLSGEAALTITATGSLGTSILLIGASNLALITAGTLGSTLSGSAALTLSAVGELISSLSLFISFGGSSLEWKQDPTPDWVSANSIQNTLNSASLHSTEGTCTVRLAAVAGDVTARLRDVTNNVTCGTSAVVVAPGTTLTTVSFAVTLSSGTATYEIQLLPSLADTDVLLGSGSLEVF